MNCGVLRIDKNGLKTYYNNGEWGLLCDKTCVYEGEWYANNHIKCSCTDADYTYQVFKIITGKVNIGDKYIFDIDGVKILGEVSGYNDSKITIYGMENFEVLLSDIDKVITQCWYVLCNSGKDEDVEYNTYYNSGNYHMYSDISNATRYRNIDKLKDEIKYLESCLDGRIHIVPLHQIERNYSLRPVKNFHPETLELIFS